LPQVIGEAVPQVIIGEADEVGEIGCPSEHASTCCSTSKCSCFFRSTSSNRTCRSSSSLQRRFCFCSAACAFEACFFLCLRSRFIICSAASKSPATVHR
jgi:hypothetical protein